MTDYSITHFTVTGLFGDTTISVPIRKNRLLIVGVNGLGKSTVLNMFYFFISRQWHRLLDYDFKQLTLTINDADLTISNDEIIDPLTYPTDVPLRAFDNSAGARTILNRASWDGKYRAQLLRFASSESVSQYNLARLTGVQLSSTDSRLLRMFLSSTKGLEYGSARLRDISEFLGQNISAQILYLPTYRRIEKDLNTVLPGLEDQLERYREATRRDRSVSTNPYLELVEFGMEDVDRSIQQTLAKQKETARAELSSLAGSYLRDVLRGEGDHFEQDRIAALSDENVEDILNRVEEHTLSDEDKSTLRTVIRTVRARGELSTSARYVAHFFIKLLSARQKLHDNEAPVTRFVDVCNAYLVGKRLTYDDGKYEIKVMRNEREIGLATLSSGEKQIVSLFSQLYLGAPNSYIIVIDEPELSLSVNWQKQLLPDLLASKRCSFIAAATHSPFVFDNEFDDNVVDLSEHVIVSQK